MPTQEEERARKFARLMGILYGAVIGLELTDQPVTYVFLEQIMGQHCTPEALKAAGREGTVSYEYMPFIGKM